MNHALTHERISTSMRMAPIGVAAATLSACCAVLAIFSLDVRAALSIWNDNAAYSHCYLVLPVSLYLIYSQRSELRRIEPVPSLFGATTFLACLGVWWIGMAASITELRQFALVGMLQSVVLCLLGWRLYRRILFPMLYLFIMVPTGTVLLGPLQTLTAMLSTSMLSLAGIPVFSEGYMIEVPHGFYEVAPGCAGLNFLLSTLALSLIYVYMVYRGKAKRVVGVAIALLLSMLTNAVRVFGIIWLAEATERRIDIVDDHLLYGWGVYAAFMLAAMAVGLWFRDPPLPEIFTASDTPKFRPNMSRLWLAATAMVILAGGIHTSFAAINPTTIGDARVRLDLPVRAGEWFVTESGGGLPPLLSLRSDGISRRSYAKAEGQVDVLIAYYGQQREGHKIIDTAAVLAENGNWQIENRGRRMVLVGGAPLPVQAIQLSRGKNRILVWSYYWVAGIRTANALSARLLGMGATVGIDGRSATVILSAVDDDGLAGTMLADFLRDAQMLEPALTSTLLRAN